MRLRFLLSIAAFATSSLAAHADSFTFAINGYTFSLPSEPTTYSSATDSVIYQNVPIFHNGTSQLEEVGFIDASFGSGLGIGRTVQCFENGECSTTYPVLADALTTTDIFTGSPSAPIFTIGTYTGVSGYNAGDGSLTIADSLAATPEPSSIALVGTGMLGMAGMIRKRYTPR